MLKKRVSTFAKPRLNCILVKVKVSMIRGRFGSSSRLSARNVSKATAGCKANLKPQGHYARAINILFDMFSHISVISPWIALASGLRKRRTLQSSQAFDVGSDVQAAFTNVHHLVLMCSDARCLGQAAC